ISSCLNSWGDCGRAYQEPGDSRAGTTKSRAPSGVDRVSVGVSTSTKSSASSTRRAAALIRARSRMACAAFGRRPEGNENPGLATGAIELTASEVVVLNECAPLPFQVSSSLDETVGEEARFKYRYLDLRRPKAANAMRLRARMSAAASRSLPSAGEGPGTGT